MTNWHKLLLDGNLKEIDSILRTKMEECGLQIPFNILNWPSMIKMVGIFAEEYSALDLQWHILNSGITVKIEDNVFISEHDLGLREQISFTRSWICSMTGRYDYIDNIYGCDGATALLIARTFLTYLDARWDIIMKFKDN